MNITTCYIKWPEFTAFAGDADFEERYFECADSDDGVPGLIDIDECDNWSDSFISFHEASEYMDKHISKDNSWRPFAEKAFLSIINDPEPHNDLNIEVDPELFAAILSPQSIQRIMQPIKDLSPVWNDAPDSCKEEIHRIHSIWSKASERGYGIAYHLG